MSETDGGRLALGAGSTKGGHFLKRRAVVAGAWTSGNWGWKYELHFARDDWLPGEYLRSREALATTPLQTEGGSPWSTEFGWFPVSGSSKTRGPDLSYWRRSVSADP